MNNNLMIRATINSLALSAFFIGTLIDDIRLGHNIWSLLMAWCLYSSIVDTIRFYKEIK